MAQRAGRVVCPRCGANNFDTVSACWKCSAPLGAAGGAAPAAPAPSYTPSPLASPVATPVAPSYGPAAVPVASQAESFAYRAAGAAIQMGDMARSNRAAFWLGMLFPYFGFPIGLAFMMCDDRRRQEVGRICILWSLVSGAVHLLLMFVSLIGLREWLMIALGTVKGAINKGGGGGLGGGLDGGGL